MNTYKKYCPNVFIAVCDEKHQKGDEITITTKYGKENKHIIHNFIGYTGTKDDQKFCYSITRSDGYDNRERAKNKVNRLSGYANNAERRSEDYYKKADLSESATGIPFGQPILLGHHSERAHRKVIERAHIAFDKSMEEQEKAKKYKSRAEYWEKMTNKIDLSMPESLGYFKHKLEEAKKEHQYLKNNPSKRAHSYSLTYAKKAVNEMQKNLNLAVKLWGDEEEIKQIEKEKKEAAQAKAKKTKGKEDLIKKYGGFFFFGSDSKAFKMEYNKLL